MIYKIEKIVFKDLKRFVTLDVSVGKEINEFKSLNHVNKYVRKLRRSLFPARTAATVKTNVMYQDLECNTTETKRLEDLFYI